MAAGTVESRFDSAVLATLRSVVRQFDEFEDERDLFDIEAATAWKRMSSGQPVLAAGATAGDYEFGGAFAETLSFLMLLWGSYKAIGEIKAKIEALRARRTESERIVSETWIAHLRDAGLAPDVARKIVEAHGPAMAEHVLQFVTADSSRAT